MPKISKERKEAIKKFNLPTYKEIPDVGLYLDQTSKYINDALGVLEENSITNSMISNYVKKHLVSNPVKKQYYREQIATLIFITLTKSILSLDNIAKLMNIEKDNYDSEEAYNLFSNYFNEYLHEIYSDKDIVSVKDKDENKALLKNVLITSVRNIYLNEWLNEE